MTDNQAEIQGHIDRRAALEAAKQACDVSPGLAPELFAVIVKKSQPDLTQAQLDEGYAIYLKLTGRAETPAV